MERTEKRVPWGSTTGTSPRYPWRYMQNRMKTRFERMYLRLRNFHRGVDLNIPTPLTMQRCIVTIGKMHFSDHHQFSLWVLNSVSTSYDKSVRFSVCGISIGFSHLLFQSLQLYLTEFWCAFEKNLPSLS